MRKRIFILAFSLASLSVTPLLAQSQFMLSGGLNLSSFSLTVPSGAQEPDQSFRVGGGILLGGQNQSSDNFAVAGGIGYETRGAVWTGTDPFSGQSVDVDINFSYIQIPLILKFLGGNRGSVQPYFAPSLAAGILTTSEAEADGKTSDIQNVTSFNLDLGGAVGFQVHNNFFMEAGYAYGLIDTDDNDQSSANTTNIKLRIGFLLGS